MRNQSILILGAMLFLSGCTSVPPERRVEVVTHWVEPTRLGERWELRPQERTKPVVVGEIIYFANLSGEVSAMHRTEGYLLWKKRLPAGVEGALTYARSKIFVGDIQGNLYALNARDGSQSWHFKIKSEWLSPPAVLRDRVFVATSHDELYALNENTGKEIWHYSHRGDEKMTVRGTSGPVVYGSEVFQGFADGYLVGLSAEKGTVLWERRLRQKERFYDVDMVPYADEKSVVAATFDGRLFSLDRLTGETKWMFPAGSYGGFLVDGEKIYFAALNGNAYALKRDSGEVVWKTSMERGVGLTPVKVGEYLAITTSSDPVYLLKPSSGEVEWSGNLGAGTLAAPASDGSSWFYCMSNYGVLYSFEIQPGWRKKPVPGTLPTPSALHRNVVEPREPYRKPT